MQAGLTCHQFLQITPFTFNEHNSVHSFIKLRIFFAFGFLKRRIFKKRKNIKNNRTMYKELKLKKRELHF
jgi:hypothetical protein